LCRKENIESRVLEYCKESDASAYEKKDLDEKISELDLELEIKAEELRIANEEFEAYKFETLTAKKQNLDPQSLEFKLIDIENQNKLLSNTLLKLNDEKKHETEILKKQIEDLKIKTKALESLSAKDEEIRILKDKNGKYENVIIELKEQINAFSSSAEMLDNIVTEKYEMETEIVELREEIKQIKEEFELAEQLNEEYELCIKENNLIIRGKDDEILRLNNQIMMINQSIEENDVKQKKILEMYNKSQADVKILKEELSRNNNNINVDDIINANVKKVILSIVCLFSLII
jgi:chromosome segregation ATPase